jgi:four helix bundle protein
MGQLRVLQEAARLARLTYAAVAAMRQRDQRDLGDQMRRAALSVHANIAEGSARRPGKDRARLLGLAWGSLRELEAHVQLAGEIGCLEANVAEDILRCALHTGRLLAAYWRAAER